jgi:hypothetical protein
VNKKCKSKTRYVSRLSKLFLSTNMFVQVLETVQRKEKRIWKMIGCEQPTSARAWHTGLSGAPGWPTVNQLLSGKRQRRMAKIHRTVRWCTGLSGEPTAPVANGRPCDQCVTRGPCQRSVGHTGLSGAPTGPEDQRSDAPDMEGDRTPDCYSDCPVVHRTVRCTTRQKARLAFQVGLQRLLVVLGL